MSNPETAPKPRPAALGSSLADLLEETGEYQAIRRDALKQVLAWQLEQARLEQGLTKAALAERLQTSRSQLHRLLDPKNAEVSLASLERLAQVLGKSVRVDLTEASNAAVKPARRKKAAAATEKEKDRG